MADEPVYVVFSYEHHGQWWGPAFSGYVRELSRAGRYTQDQALRICARAVFGSGSALNEVPVRLEDAEMMRALSMEGRELMHKALM